MWIIGFLLSWPLLIFVNVILLAVFSASISMGFYNFSNGRKKHWPAKHIVGSIVCLLIAITVLVMAVLFNVNFIQSF